MAINLVTTGRVAIIGGLVPLPGNPVSDILRNTAIVYASDGSATEHDSVSVIHIDGNAYAQFENAVEGFAVVSYLAGF